MNGNQLEVIFSLVYIWITIFDLLTDGIRPLATTFSSTTRAGVVIMLNFIISTMSSIFVTVASIPFLLQLSCYLFEGFAFGTTCSQNFYFHYFDYCSSTNSIKHLFASSHHLVYAIFNVRRIYFSLNQTGSFQFLEMLGKS